MRFLGWLRERLYRAAFYAAFGVVSAFYLAVYLATFYGQYWIAEYLFGPWWPVGLFFVILPLGGVVIALVIFLGKQRLSGG